MMPPMLRDGGKAGFSAPDSTSTYLIPEPVLKSTTRSVGFRNSLASNFSYATSDAAPSGAAKIPSSEAHVRTANKISSSVAVTAVPPDFFRMSRMM